MRISLLLLTLCLSASALAMTSDEHVNRCLNLRALNDKISCLQKYEAEILDVRNECIAIVFKNNRRDKFDYTRASDISVSAKKASCRLESKNKIRVETCIVYELLDEAEDICLLD